MARPKKVKEVIEKTPEQQTIEKLQNELEEMKKLIMNLSNTSITQQKVIEDKIEDESQYVAIRPDKYIQVISLENNPMILSTEGYGKGKIYRFEDFGESQMMVYKDLSEIIHHQYQFAKDGRFYIVDKDVVRLHGLVGHYDKILTKDKIEQILDFDKETMVQLFKNTTDAQKDAIVSIIVDKLNNKDNIDLNKVDSLSRVYGRNISEMVQLEEIEEE